VFDLLCRQGEGMENEELIAALRSGEQETACRIIGEMDSPGDLEIEDLSGNRRRYHLVHIAAFAGQPDVLKTLVAKTVDISVPESTHKGWTALHFAAQHRHREIADILMTNDVDHAAKDSDGRTALDFANEYGHDDIAEIIGSH